MGRGRKGSRVEPLKTCIRVRFMFMGERIYETVKLEPTPRNVKVMEQHMLKVERAIEGGMFTFAEFFPSSPRVAAESEKRPASFREYVDEHLKAVTGEASTMENYIGDLKNFWSEHLGGKALSEIVQSDVSKAIAAKKKAGVSGKRINNMLVPMRALFAAAKADRVIEHNPMDGIKSQKHQSPQPDPFTKDEMEAIIAHMWDHCPPLAAAYYAGAFRTGMRPSEQIVVGWPGMDWNMQTLRIDSARVRHQKKATKTHSVRDIELTEPALEVMKFMKQHTFMKDRFGPIFENPLTGRPFVDEATQRDQWFYPTLIRLGIRVRGAKQTRHTYATTALMAGTNPNYIAKQLGHANAKMVYEVYSKWIEGADKGAQRRIMNQAFGHGLAMEEMK